MKNPFDPDEDEEKAEGQRRQGLIQQNVLQQQAARRGGGGGRAPAAHAQAPQPNMFQEHAAMQADMYASTNAAWQREHNSRVAQAREARQQEHEYQLEMLRQQGAAQRAQAAPEGGYGSPPSDQARQARNRLLLGMAGLGGHAVRNGRVTPHPYQTPLARSLLG